jgi:hypothetical protein
LKTSSDFSAFSLAAQQIPDVFVWVCVATFSLLCNNYFIATNQPEISMSTKQQLIDHLADLEKARDEAFTEGNWGRVDLLGNCIDDTNARIAKLSAA